MSEREVGVPRDKSAEAAERTARLNEDSAVTAARLIVENADLLRPAHVSELLSVAVWMYTEARGKYQTRYTTPAARADGAKVRHEHVIPRKTIRQALLQHRDRVAQIMRLSTACIVTQEEHKLLRSPSIGWHRYKDAGMTVLDRETGAVVDLDRMAEALALAWHDATRQS